MKVFACEDVRGKILNVITVCEQEDRSKQTFEYKGALYASGRHCISAQTQTANKQKTDIKRKRKGKDHYPLK